MPTITRERLRTNAEKLTTAKGRRQLQMALSRRLSPRSIRNADILIDSSTWLSRPSGYVSTWQPLQQDRRTLYVEETAGQQALVKRRSDHTATNEAMSLLDDMFKECATVAWAYPPAIDAWSLADLLHSIQGASPHAWNRADHAAFFFAVDPYGAGSILLARTMEHARSVVVLTAASSIEGTILKSLRYVDAVIADRSHESDLQSSRLPYLACFSNANELRTLVTQAVSDLTTADPDPLMPFAPSESPRADWLAQYGKADVILHVVGDFTLHDTSVEPRTFRALINANTSEIRVLMARQSLLVRNRGVVARQEHERFVEFALEEGLRIELA